MRGVHSAVDDIRRSVFTEVARLAYESDDYKQVDMIPTRSFPERLPTIAMTCSWSGPLFPPGSSWLWAWIWTPTAPLPHQRQYPGCATDQKYFNEPLVNIISFACNACPPKQIRITDSCQAACPILA